MSLTPAYISFRKSLVQETNSSVTCDQFIPWVMPESLIIINVFLAAFFNERNRYRDFKSLLSVTCLWVLLSFIMSRKSGWQKLSIRECNHKTPLPPKQKCSKLKTYFIYWRTFFLLCWNTLQEIMTVDKKIFPHQEVQKIKMLLKYKLKEFINVSENIIAELLV